MDWFLKLVLNLENGEWRDEYQVRGKWDSCVTAKSATVAEYGGDGGRAPRESVHGEEEGSVRFENCVEQGAANW